MKISIGSDHRGHDQRKTLTEILDSLGHQVDDCGSFGEDSADYPDIAVVVCNNVVAGKSDRGILVCGTGIGMSIAANKVDGARAALCNDLYLARMAREHNNANVLSIGGRVVGLGLAEEIVTLFLNTEFEGGRHQRRVDLIIEVEQSNNGERRTTVQGSAATPGLRRVALGLDIEAAVEPGSQVLNRNEVGELGELLLGELSLKPSPQVVIDRRRRHRQRFGVLDDELFDLGKVRSLSPVGDGIEGCIIEAQLTAERSSDVLSPQAPDHRRRSQLGQRLEPVIDRASERNPALQGQRTEQRRLVWCHRPQRGRKGRPSAENLHGGDESHCVPPTAVSTGLGGWLVELLGAHEQHGGEEHREDEAANAGNHIRRFEAVGVRQVVDHVRHAPDERGDRGDRHEVSGQTDSSGDEQYGECQVQGTEVADEVLIERPVNGRPRSPEPGEVVEERLRGEQRPETKLQRGKREPAKSKASGTCDGHGLEGIAQVV